VLQEEAPALIGGPPSKIGIERSTARVSVLLSSYGLSTRFRNAWLRHGASPLWVPTISPPLPTGGSGAVLDASTGVAFPQWTRDLKRAAVSGKAEGVEALGVIQRHFEDLGPRPIPLSADHKLDEHMPKNTNTVRLSGRSGV